MTLRQAAASSGISLKALRLAAFRGSITGRRIEMNGRLAWVVTPEEVARYAAESKGRPGRKPGHKE